MLVSSSIADPDPVDPDLAPCPNLRPPLEDDTRRLWLPDDRTSLLRRPSPLALELLWLYPLECEEEEEEEEEPFFSVPKLNPETYRRLATSSGPRTAPRISSTIESLTRDHLGVTELTRTVVVLLLVLVL